MSEKLIIFDTTLRDGEQSPGASMTRDEKVRIAKVLEKMRVDVIEAGFPIASAGDFESVKSVGELGLDATICGLSRTRRGDIGLDILGQSSNQNAFRRQQTRIHIGSADHLDPLDQARVEDLERRQ